MGQLAHDVLVIQVSTVALESPFMLEVVSKLILVQNFISHFHFINALMDIYISQF